MFITDLEKTKSQIGTVFYMSPELILGDSYSYPTDIWAMGAILYEICYLKKLFDCKNPFFIQRMITES